MQQHLQEGEVVARGRVERTAPRPELGGERGFQRLGHERAVWLALMHAGLARALFVGGAVAAVPHAEGPEDPLAEIHVERLPAHLLDQAPHPVGVHAIFPFVARVEDEGHADRCDLACGRRGHPRGLDVADHVRVPDLIAEPGRVGQQVTQRDRALGGPQLRRPRSVEPVQHLGRPERGVDVRHRLLELELALLDELHRRHGGDRLGHRGDAKHGVESHGRGLVEGAHAEGALVEEAPGRGGHGHHAGHFSGVDGLLQHAVDASAR